MQSNDKLKQYFLKKFIGTIIHNIRQDMLQQGINRQQLLRSQQEIEVGKLRKKFAEYLEKPPLHETEAIKQEISKNITPPLPLIRKTSPPKQESTQQKLKKPLPARASYLLPTGEIDFGKILPYLRDPSITSIECQGPSKNIILKRSGQVITTQTKLTDHEIDIIVHGFSERARIPLIEGLLRARIENTTMAAVVSKLVSSKFIITKESMPALAPRPVPRRLAPTQIVRPRGVAPPVPIPRPAPPQSVPPAPIKQMPRVQRPIISPKLLSQQTPAITPITPEPPKPTLAKKTAPKNIVKETTTKSKEVSKAKQGYQKSIRAK